MFGVAHVGVLFFSHRPPVTALLSLLRAATHPCLLLPGNSPVTEVGSLLFIAFCGYRERYRAVRSSGIITVALALWMEQVLFNSVMRKPYLSSLVILTHIK